MAAISISDPQHFERAGRPVVSASVDAGEKSYNVWARFSAGPVASGSDAFLVAALMPSMKLGAALRVAGPVSPRLLENISRIQEYCHTQDQEFLMNQAEAEAGTVDPPTAERGVGCFFSGGIDSFYTLMKHENEITHIVFVLGFESWLNNLPLQMKGLEAARRVAAELGKELIEVETSLREFSDHYVGWGPYHGVAAAFVAHLLSPRLRKIYFAGGMTYSNLKPFGTNPFLFSLWSSDAIDLVGDGYEAGRMDKVARVAQSDLALRTIRVCWKNKNLDGAYNCGRCEKCLRTMVSLRIVGAMDRCSTFDHPLDVAAVSWMRFEDPVVRIFWEENMLALERLGSDPKLARAVRDLLDQRFDSGIWRLARNAFRRQMVLRRLGRRTLTRLGFAGE